ncbi:MAG: universal stress protein [Dehalococcoidia bacterium]|nr:MAG: universal stress protein [Dehalococcoidia bacterium]
MYKTILVPLDGSKTAEKVLIHAKALAYSEGAEIIILNVAANLAQEFAFEDPSIAGYSVAEEEQKAKDYVVKVCDDLKAHGFKVSYQLYEGSPANTILKVAEIVNADIITMSTHGRNWPAKWLLGSVAERVVRHSNIPIMMIRADET